MFPVISASSSSTTSSSASSPSSSQESTSDNRGVETPVSERNGGMNEELRGDPLHESTKTENKKKMENQKKYKERYRMNCLIGYRNSERIWLIKVLQQSLREIQSKEVKTLPSHLMNFQWNREQKWSRIRVSTVYLRTFRRIRNSDICLKTKITRAFCRRRAGTVVLGAENFGDLITADHKVLSDGSELRHNHRYAVVVQDLATQWLQSYPCKTKSSQETSKNLMQFVEPARKPKVIYTDNSIEFGKACEDLSWNHCTSTPHRSETNGIAERAVRRVKEGTSAVLLQSGLDWKMVGRFYGMLYLSAKHSRSLIWWKTPFERRFGQPFKGPIIPFGSLVEYHPTSAKDWSRMHQFGKKVLPGMFLGYALNAGGIWKGDIMVADTEELEEMDASELHARRLNAKEVFNAAKK